ncbi:Peptidoglycan O-acetyltransferase [Rubripirellula tenax]|uniref:Peptidoglycan O-acetyltransferase n=1 Tax=Rubripirellula tenax TaxID=2528015 RepID=A0A5C6EFZ5_9BACT|nr:MBOAT family O-acyltransferase [Rubripirellula tenax]TWU47520.1 Peptidoglycan O-acetyltransferase [Rubripirellula tenax]
MLFNSLTFLLFLIVATALYWLLPRRQRLWMLFLASVMFYGFWRVDFIALMLVSSTTDYCVSLLMAKEGNPRRKWLLLLLSLSINLSLLFVFKYSIFAVENAWLVLGWFGVSSPPPVLNIILPLGISFYTFQTISYSIDVYRGFIKPERDYVLYSVYVMYFPQLVAGPILRANEVLPQLDERPRFQFENLVVGTRRILFGLFLKVVLADNIGETVDSGFSSPASTMSAIDVWTLAFLFGFQIYFDFSAYSHIAIGSARLMGIRFPENFNYPYFAVSPRDFWRRWHISLSSWIRDYLYLPLAGAKVRDESTGGLGSVVSATQVTYRWTTALFLTWAIMGLWHGAAWKFLVWGLWHAVMVYVYRESGTLRERLPRWLRNYGGWALTLGLTMLAWIPFRAANMSDTFTMLGKVASPAQYLSLGMRENTYILAAAVMLALGVAFVGSKVLEPMRERFPVLCIAPEALVYAVAISSVFVFLRPIQQFIYFQF